MGALKAFLRELLEECTRELPRVTNRRMFGSHAFFVQGKIFALEWDDRIALKLHERADFDALLALPGARTRSPAGDNPMSKWLLAPESFHDDPEALLPWVINAHQQALAAPRPMKKKPKAKKRSAMTKKRR